MTREETLIAIFAVFVILTAVTTGIAASQKESPTNGTCGESSADQAERSPNQRLPRVDITIVPEESRITRDQTGIFLVCIVNPRAYNTTIRNPIIEFWHDFDQSDSVYVTGRHNSISADSRVGTLSLNESWRDGSGRAIWRNELKPGEVAHYTIVVSDAAKTGRNRIRVDVSYPFFLHGSWREFETTETARLAVVCPPSCVVASGYDEVMAFAGAYWEVLVGVATIVGVIITLLGPKNVRGFLGGVRGGKIQEARGDDKRGKE